MREAPSTALYCEDQPLLPPSDFRCLTAPVDRTQHEYVRIIRPRRTVYSGRTDLVVGVENGGRPLKTMNRRRRDIRHMMMLSHPQQWRRPAAVMEQHRRRSLAAAQQALAELGRS